MTDKRKSVRQEHPKDEEAVVTMADLENIAKGIFAKAEPPDSPKRITPKK